MRGLVTIVTLFFLCCLIYPSVTFSQDMEKAIIPLQDLTQFIGVFTSFEETIVNHTWDVLFSAYFHKSYRDKWMENERWKNLEWIAPLFYPEDVPAADAAKTRADSITSIGHFISDMAVFKNPDCIYVLKIEGVRKIEFDVGKKYIPFSMSFCFKDDLWLLLEK